MINFISFRLVWFEVLFTIRSKELEDQLGGEVSLAYGGTYDDGLPFIKVTDGTDGRTIDNIKIVDYTDL